MAMSPMGGGSDDSYQPISDINVTPFVDVMLVLLIVFMVAAPLMTVGVPVDLPKTQAAQLDQKDEPVTVSIDKDGKIYLKDQEIEPGLLKSRLAALWRETPDATVHVRGDGAIAYSRIMEIMGAVNTAGFSKVALVAEGGDDAPVKAN